MYLCVSVEGLPLLSLDELLARRWFHGTLNSCWQEAPRLHVGTVQAALEVLSNRQWRDFASVRPVPFTLQLHRLRLLPSAFEGPIFEGLDEGGEEWGPCAGTVLYRNSQEDKGSLSMILRRGDYVLEDSALVELAPRRRRWGRLVSTPTGGFRWLASFVEAQPSFVSSVEDALRH